MGSIQINSDNVYSGTKAPFKKRLKKLLFYSIIQSIKKLSSKKSFINEGLVPMSDNKRYAGFSLKEISILILGIIGVFNLHYTFPDKWWRALIVSYALGLCFESMMAPLFTYCNAIRNKHCIDGSDVNFVLPLGWVEVAATTALISSLIFKEHLFIGYIGTAFVIGNIHEFFFYKLGYWDYNYDKKMIGNYKPLWPKITLAGVPLQVMIGYCNVGIFSYFIFNVLVR